MNGKRTKQGVLIIVCVVLAWSNAGMSMILVGGADPVEDHGWPVGSVELANLPTRVSWWAGPPFGTGSMYEFQYECESTDQFYEALKVFTRINASKLELVIRNGPKPDGSPGGNKQTDWTFTVWNPEDWDNLNNRHHNNTFELNRSPVQSACHRYASRFDRSRVRRDGPGRYAGCGYVNGKGNLRIKDYPDT